MNIQIVKKVTTKMSIDTILALLTLNQIIIFIWSFNCGCSVCNRTRSKFYVGQLKMKKLTKITGLRGVKNQDGVQSKQIRN